MVEILLLVILSMLLVFEFRMLVTLIRALKRTSLKRGVVARHSEGGMGIAICIEAF
jgi:hypothetical protein